MQYELLHGNCFKRSMKSSVDFNKYVCGMCGFIKLSRYLANVCSGVPTIDTIGLKGVLSLWTLAKPCSLPGLLPNWTAILQPNTNAI